MREVLYLVAVTVTVTPDPWDEQNELASEVESVEQRYKLFALHWEAVENFARARIAGIVVVNLILREVSQFIARCKIARQKVEE